MKTSLKQMLLTAMIVTGFSSFSNSQITKSDVESLMGLQGVSMLDMKKAYVYNVKTFYTDGTYKFVYETYEDLKYTLKDNGITIQGKTTQFFPFSSIKHFTIGVTSFTIHLLE